jgi:hypothetical protein
MAMLHLVPGLEWARAADPAGSTIHSIFFVKSSELAQRAAVEFSIRSSVRVWLPGIGAGGSAVPI